MRIDVDRIELITILSSITHQKTLRDIYRLHLSQILKTSSLESKILKNLSKIIKGKKRYLVIIDEAQILNLLSKDHIFWSDIKSAQDMDVQHRKLHVILLGVFEEGPSSVQTLPSVLGSPVELNTLDFQTLLLSDEKYNILVDNYNKVSRGLQLCEQVKTYIQRRLGGHVGLIVKLLGHLDTDLGSQRLRAEASRAKEIKTNSEVVKDHTQGAFIYVAEKAMKSLKDCRAVSSIKNEELLRTPRAIHFINKILIAGAKLEVDKLNQTKVDREAFDFLLSNYYMTPTANGYEFASPFVHYVLCGFRSDGRTAFKELRPLIRAAISRMTFDQIRSSESQSKKGNVLEDPFTGWFSRRNKDVGPRHLYIRDDAFNFLQSYPLMEYCEIDRRKSLTRLTSHRIR